MKDRKVYLELESIFTIVDAVLSDWKGEGNIQVATLMELVARKKNWTANEIRQNDPVVRFYIRNHDEWIINRGAYGGISKIGDRKKKTITSTKKIINNEVKEKLKEEMKLAIEAKLVKKTDVKESVILNKFDTSSDYADSFDGDFSEDSEEFDLEEVFSDSEYND